MENKYLYWRWKSTIIDFSKILNENLKNYIFRYLPLPDVEIHRWYNGGWSSEYNEALFSAKEYGLIEFIDIEEEEEEE